MRYLLFILGIFIGSSLKALQNFEYLSVKETHFENSLPYQVLIKGEPNNKKNILKRMEYYKVPGVSIAIVNNGQIEWVKGYGHLSNNLKVHLNNLYHDLMLVMLLLGIIKKGNQYKENGIFIQKWQLQVFGQPLKI